MARTKGCDNKATYGGSSKEHRGSKRPRHAQPAAPKKPDEEDNLSDDSIEISDPVPVVSMRTIRADMSLFLQNELQNSPSYCYYSRIKSSQSMNPFLSVPGFGSVGIPLNGHLAQCIIPRCRPHTFEGSAVPRAWELSPNELTFNNPTWTEWMRGKVLPALCQTLGINAEDTSLEFDRLVLYESGSSPKKARITAQDDSATLGFVQIILPSCHTSASEAVSHSGQRTDTSLADPEGVLTTIVGYYVGTTLEQKPIETGWRIALVYRIRQPDVNELPSIPKTSPTLRIIRILQPWVDASLKHFPQCLGFLLRDNYEASEILSSDMLEGIDKTLFDQLAPAGRQIGCSILFARITCTRECDITVSVRHHGGVMTSDEWCDIMCGVNANDLKMKKKFEEHLDVDEVFDEEGLLLDRSRVSLEKVNLLGEELTARKFKTDFEPYERNEGSLTHTWEGTALLIRREEMQSNGSTSTKPRGQAAKKRKTK